MPEKLDGNLTAAQGRYKEHRTGSFKPGQLVYFDGPSVAVTAAD